MNSYLQCRKYIIMTTCSYNFQIQTNKCGNISIQYKLLLLEHFKTWPYSFPFLIIAQFFLKPWLNCIKISFFLFPMNNLRVKFQQILLLYNISRPWTINVANTQHRSIHLKKKRFLWKKNFLIYYYVIYNTTQFLYYFLKKRLSI